LKAIVARLISFAWSCESVMRVIPMYGRFSAFIPLGDQWAHHAQSRTHLRQGVTFADVTGWRYLRRSPDSRPRGARNWARYRTTPNQSDESAAGSNGANERWKTNTVSVIVAAAFVVVVVIIKGLGHVLATSYLVLPCPTRLLHGEWLPSTYLPDISLQSEGLSSFRNFLFFFLSFLLSRMTASKIILHPSWICQTYRIGMNSCNSLIEVCS